MIRIMITALGLIFAFSINASAMTFTQPIKIGHIGCVNMGGGFAFRQVSENKGVLTKHRGLGGAIMYDKGVARFGDGADALYLHYNYSADRGYNQSAYSSKFGSSDIKNTVNIKILNPEIFQIKTDNGMTFFAITDSYDLTEEFRYVLIGKQKNGNWVKYFDTFDIVKKYFNKNQSHWLKTFEVKPYGISIYYELYSPPVNYKMPTGRGEFRFKWDDKAQWFSVEQVVY